MFALISLGHAEVKVSVYSTVQELEASAGHWVLSGPSLNAERIKEVDEPATVAVAAYTETPDGRFYISDWSWQRYKSNGIKPNWLWLKPTAPSSQVALAKLAIEHPYSPGPQPDGSYYEALPEAREIIFPMGATHSDEIGGDTRYQIEKFDLVDVIGWLDAPSDRAAGKRERWYQKSERGWVRALGANCEVKRAEIDVYDVAKSMFFPRGFASFTGAGQEATIVGTHDQPVSLEIAGEIQTGGKIFYITSWSLAETARGRMTTTVVGLEGQFPPSSAGLDVMSEAADGQAWIVDGLAELVQDFPDTAGCAFSHFVLHDLNTGGLLIKDPRFAQVVGAFRQEAVVSAPRVRERLLAMRGFLEAKERFEAIYGRDDSDDYDEAVNRVFDSVLARNPTFFKIYSRAESESTRGTNFRSAFSFEGITSTQDWASGRIIEIMNEIFETLAKFSGDDQRTLLTSLDQAFDVSVARVKHTDELFFLPEAGHPQVYMSYSDQKEEINRSNDSVSALATNLYLSIAEDNSKAAMEGFSALSSGLEDRKHDRSEGVRNADSRRLNAIVLGAVDALSKDDSRLVKTLGRPFLIDQLSKSLTALKPVNAPHGAISIPASRQALDFDGTNHSPVKESDAMIRVFRSAELTSDYDSDARESKYHALVHRTGRRPELVTFAASADFDIFVELMLRNYTKRRMVLMPGTERDLDQWLDGFFTEVYGRVFRTLLPHLDGVKRIYWEGDGYFHFLPMDLILSHYGKTDFGDDVRLIQVADGGALQRTPSWDSERSLARGLLVGGINYEEAADKADMLSSPGSEAGRAVLRHCRSMSGGFSRLPATEREVLDLKSFLPEAKILMEAEATQSLVCTDLVAARSAHFATHGFFLDRADVLEAYSGQQLLDRLDSPFYRSGLALSGANSTCRRWGEGAFPDPKADGILMAAEFQELDLSNLDLLVMSACSTAEGQVANGGSIMGMRSALLDAGVENVVLTLWSVVDNYAPEFMNAFYQRCAKGASPADAMWDVKTREFERLVKESGLTRALRLAGPFFCVSNAVGSK